MNTNNFSTISYDVDDVDITQVYQCATCERRFTWPGRKRKYCSQMCASRGRNIVSIKEEPKPVGSRGPKIGAGTVYVIGHSPSEGPVKIGKSGPDNEVNRLGYLQGGNPKKLHILGSIYVKDCDMIENQIHNLFSANRLEGEWFDIHPNEAMIALRIKRVIDTKTPAMCSNNAYMRLFTAK